MPLVNHFRLALQVIGWVWCVTLPTFTDSASSPMAFALPYDKAVTLWWKSRYNGDSAYIPSSLWPRPPNFPIPFLSHSQLLKKGISLGWKLMDLGPHSWMPQLLRSHLYRECHGCLEHLGCLWTKPSLSCAQPASCDLLMGAGGVILNWTIFEKATGRKPPHPLLKYPAFFIVHAKALWKERNRSQKERKAKGTEEKYAQW